jgi:hypothetical protein
MGLRGMIFDISGAVVSRASAGDHGPELILPFVIACVVALSWRLRPADRRLVAAARDRLSLGATASVVGQSCTREVVSGRSDQAPGLAFRALASTFYAAQQEAAPLSPARSA